MKLIKKVLIIAAFGALFASCTGVFEGKTAGVVSQNADGKTLIRVDAASTKTSKKSRTVSPYCDVSELTSFVLYGIRIDGLDVIPDLDELVRADTLEELSKKEIELAAGSWNFQLKASYNGLEFSGAINKTLTAGTTTALEFVLSCSETNGSFSITLNFEGNAVKAVATLLGSDSKPARSDLYEVPLTISGSSVVFELPYSGGDTGLSAGTYTAQIEFFGDEDGQILLNTYSEVVRIAGGYISKADRSISLNDLYKISYVPYGGSLVDGDTQPLYYSRFSSPDLPQMEKSGYAFAGWYEDEAFTIPAFSSDYNSGEKTLYAAFINSITVDSETGSPTANVVIGEPAESLSMALGIIAGYPDSDAKWTLSIVGTLSDNAVFGSSLESKGSSFLLTGADDPQDGVPADTIEAENTYDSVISVKSDITLTIQKLKITGGTTGVYTETGTVTLGEDCLVTGNGASSGVSISGGTVILDGGRITDNSNYQGGGVSMSGGEFIMESGMIGSESEYDPDRTDSYNNPNQADYNGAGVYVVGGTFTMKGGTICGHSGSSLSGAGVYVGYQNAGEEDETVGTFIMEGGTISSNQGAIGGGVFVDGSGSSLTDTVTFTMSGGSITGNKASSTNDDDARGGGGVAVYGGNAKFSMETGTISANESSCYGGGVSVVSNAVFTMSGGTIGGYDAGNTVNLSGWSTYGGGVYIRDGSFVMEGGTISYNATNSTYAQANGMSGGGAVCVYSGTFEMNGDCELSYNTSANCGGGVYIGSSGTFDMIQGSITSNTCGSDSDSDGNGIFVRTYSGTSGTFKMGGSSAFVLENDVYLSGGFVTITDELAGKVATLTPSSYDTDTQVVVAIPGENCSLSAEELLQRNYEAFAVTPDGSDIWEVDENGYLKKSE